MEHILIPFSSNTNMNYEYLDVMRFFFLISQEQRHF